MYTYISKSVFLDLKNPYLHCHIIGAYKFISGYAYMGMPLFRFVLIFTGQL